MSIVRVNGAGWSSGDKFSASQANSLDLNSTYALDKRAGQTDTLASLISCTGAGRMIPTFINGSNTSTSYQADGGNTVINVVSTGTRTYTLASTNAVTGDLISIFFSAATGSVIVVDGVSTSTIGTVGPTTSYGGQSTWADFMWNGANWILYRSGNGTKLAPLSFTAASGSWTSPSGVYNAILVGCGGGGGGGGGAGSDNTSNTYTSGGGGGGGAQLVIQYVAINPLTQYDYVIGAGGSGGAAGTSPIGPGGVGANGANTTFTIHGGATIATFVGAQGGIGGPYTTSAPPTFAASAGGAPSLIAAPSLALGPSSGLSVATLAISYWGTIFFALLGRMAGEGGFTATNACLTAQSINPQTGNQSLNGFAGGTGGTSGTTSTYHGGSGGGGGGGGAFGVGGAGGAGGNGVNGNSNVPGTAGTAAAANTGGGGGGGGGAGCSTQPSGSAGAAGGAGGSGYLIVIPLR